MMLRCLLESYVLGQAENKWAMVGASPDNSVQTGNSHPMMWVVHYGAFHKASSDV